MLADIDATCASLGYYDGSKYIPEPDALQGLKVTATSFFSYGSHLIEIHFDYYLISALDLDTAS